MASLDITMSQIMDPGTKKVLEEMTKQEFSLRRPSESFQSPEHDSAFNGPPTPEASPNESLRSSQSVDLVGDKFMTEAPKSVKESKELVESKPSTVLDASITADVPVTPPTSLRRSKRTAATRATSAIMAAFAASTSATAEAFDEDDSVEQESPAKKARITLHLQSRTNGRGHASQEVDTQSSPANATDITRSAINVSGTGSPRKRTTPMKPKVLNFTEIEAPEDHRPQPHGQPLVWAEQRQALCETLPYYRAYQSGAYTTEGLGYGFLLDKDCGERAYMDEEVVITRAGGGCKANENGTMEQADDQCSTSTKITSFVKNKEQHVPVGLIVGSKNALCPSKVPHRYCVMDFFQVTDIWAEKSNSKTCFKFRFEKIDLSTKSWWAPAGSPLPVRSDQKALRRMCTQCGKSNAQVFQNGWMCLNDGCRHFWQLNGQPAPAQLAHNPLFLNERTVWPSHIKPPFPLRPDLLVADNKNDVNLAVSRASWKGMACPKCGRCNSRTRWDAWRCQTIECGFTHGIKHTIIDPHTVLPDHGVESAGHALPQDKHLDPVTLREPEYIGDWRVHTYDLLPGNHVTHFMANGTLNHKPGGAHDMFKALQRADIGLQRFALAMSATEGESLTRHFAVNFGMPYKYIVSVDSKGFSEAPQPVMDALKRLTWAGRYCVSDGSFKDFNEELVLGYFEKQAIGYHDDGEKDLGPTIATLSLGGDAIMTLRIKQRYYRFPKDMTLDTYDPYAPLISGSQLYKERIAVNNYYRAGDLQAFEIAKAELLRKVKKCTAKNASPVLIMKLKMGDMIVMHGAEMQKFFEHSIIPEGKLRFGLTCRYIKPEQIPESEHWKGEFNIDPAESYTGDVDLTADNADFSFLENGDAGMDVAPLSENTAVEASLGSDFIMVNSPSTTPPPNEVSAMGMPASGSLSDVENNPPITLSTTASPAPSLDSDGQSRNSAVMNAPVWF